MPKPFTPRTEDELNEAASYLESAAETIGTLSIYVGMTASHEHFINKDNLAAAAASLRVAAADAGRVATYDREAARARREGAL